MLLLGIVLVVVLAVIAVFVIADATDPVQVSALGLDVSTTGSGMFVLGLIVGVLALLAVGLIARGMTRSVSRRREVRSLRKDAASTAEVEEERRRLAEERAALERDRERLETPHVGGERSAPDHGGAHTAAQDERLMERDRTADRDQPRA